MSARQPSRKGASSSTASTIIPYDAWMAQRLGVPTLTREVLEAHQLACLNRTLERVRKLSPFYARHLRALPDTPLRSLKDMETLPFTTSDHLRRKSHFMICEDRGEAQEDAGRLVTVSTAGTTGDPKTLQFREEDQKIPLGILQCSMEQVARPGAACFVFLPSSAPGSMGDLLCKATAAMGARPIPFGPVTDLQAAAEALAKEPSCSIVGIPIQVLALAKYCKKERLQRPHVHAVLLCTDYVAIAARKLLKKLWDCPVYANYDLAEAWYAGGMECSFQQGYHIHESDLYVEIIDPYTEEVVPDGEYGEVVMTTLTRTGTPLLRYRTGDISCIIPTPCRCGSVLRRLAPVESRLHGAVPLITYKFCLYFADLEEALSPISWLADFSASVRTDQRGKQILTLELFVLNADNADNRDGKADQVLKVLLGNIDVIRMACKANLLDIEIDCKSCDRHMPVSSGKRRFILKTPLLFRQDSPLEKTSSGPVAFLRRMLQFLHH